MSLIRSRIFSYPGRDKICDLVRRVVTKDLFLHTDDKAGYLFRPELKSVVSKNQILKHPFFYPFLARIALNIYSNAVLDRRGVILEPDMKGTG